MEEQGIELVVNLKLVRVAFDIWDIAEKIVENSLEDAKLGEFPRTEELVKVVRQGRQF